MMKLNHPEIELVNNPYRQYDSKQVTGKMLNGKDLYF